jgi:hypothetical protein
MSRVYETVPVTEFMIKPRGLFLPAPARCFTQNAAPPAAQFRHFTREIMTAQRMARAESWFPVKAI